MRSLAAAAIAVLIVGCGDGEEPATTRAQTTHAVATTTLPTDTADVLAVGEDLDDVEGPLDLKQVSAQRQGDLLRLELELWDPWEDTVLESPSLLVPGPNRLTLFYDIDLDGRIDYRGRFIYSEGVLSLVISGRGQAFEPVPVDRLDGQMISVVHAVDVFFVVLEEKTIESELDIAVAVRSQFGSAVDRAPDEDWVLVPFA